jgi:hypothetical protein
MMLWTVTVTSRGTAPSVHVCTDEDSARSLAKSFSQDFSSPAYSFRESAVYVQAHGIVTEGDEWEEDEIEE